MPIANHTNRRIHVMSGNVSISPKDDSAPIGATNQTQGVLNLLGKFGSRTRSTIIPTDTITNANSVPILQRFPASRTGSKAPKKATMIPVIVVITHGVLKRGCTLLTKGG